MARPSHGGGGAGGVRPADAGAEAGAALSRAISPPDDGAPALPPPPPPPAPLVAVPEGAVPDLGVGLAPTE